MRGVQSARRVNDYLCVHRCFKEAVSVPSDMFPEEAPAEKKGDCCGIEKYENCCIIKEVPMMRYLTTGGVGIVWGAVSIISLIS